MSAIWRISSTSFSDDIEAKAFLAWQIWNNSSPRHRSQQSFAINTLISEVQAVEPMHPSHHYRIHLWDGEKQEQAVKSASLCGQSAPSIAHMWHMPGHTFSGLQALRRRCLAAGSAMRVDHAYMMRDRVLPDQIHNYAHNSEWLIRT